MALHTASERETAIVVIALLEAIPYLSHLHRCNGAQG